MLNSKTATALSLALCLPFLLVLTAALFDYELPFVRRQSFFNRASIAIVC